MTNDTNQDQKTNPWLTRVAGNSANLSKLGSQVKSFGKSIGLEEIPKPTPMSSLAPLVQALPPKLKLDRTWQKRLLEATSNSEIGLPPGP